MKRLAIAAALALTALAAFGGEYELAWEGAANTLVCVELSCENLANLGGHPEWLRIRDRNGAIVPWERRQRTATRYGERRAEAALTLDEARHGDGGQLEILCHVKEGEALPAQACLSFHTRMKDFEQQVVLYGVDDGGRETPLLTDGFIFESSANIDLKNVDVPFDPQGHRRFRIVLRSASMERRAALRQVSREWDTDGKASVREQESVTEQAFKIDRVELWGVRREAVGDEPQWEEYPAGIVSQETTDDITSVTLTPAVYPVCGLRLKCDEENYCRTIRIYNILPDKELFISTGTARRIDLGTLKDETLLTFEPVNEGSLRIEIVNDDNPPLHLTDVGTRNPLYSLRFVGNAAMAPCRLTAEPNGRDPVYDTAALLSSGEAAANMVVIRPTLFTGAPVRAEAPQPVKRRGIPRAVLFVAVALAVAAMGAALASILRKTV